MLVLSGHFPMQGEVNHCIHQYPAEMKNALLFVFLFLAFRALGLNPSHLTITRVTAPYFIVDGNSPATITQSYVGFEIRNESNSGVTYSGLRFSITSIGTSVAGQNYSLVSPANGVSNIGTLAPGESRVCYFYVSYPASVTPQATFNILLEDNTAGSKIQSFTIYNRSSISANAGGTATQTFTNQDIIGGLVYDDVTYVIGNMQNGDESDFQVAVSPQFDPTKIILQSTSVIASSVPGIPVGATDSLYFITGSGSNGSSITIRWAFRIAASNFTTYLLPCAGATSGNTNYKYALNTSLGSGTPVTISSSANPLTITKTSDKSLYQVNSQAIFTIRISNPGAYGVSIDRITDQLPAGFSFGSITGGSQVALSNSTSVPPGGAKDSVVFDGGVSSGMNRSYYIPAGGSITLQYTATASSTPASNLQTTVRYYVVNNLIGSAQNTVSVSAILPVRLLTFGGEWRNEQVLLNWSTASENNSCCIEIERSTVNGMFYPIGRLETRGGSNTRTDYTFRDLMPLAEEGLYRLKLIDLDQQFSYSPVIAIKPQKLGGLNFGRIYPLPFRDQLSVEISTDAVVNVQIQLSDLTGKIVFTQLRTCNSGKNTLLVEPPASLPAGYYSLQVIAGDKMLKQLQIKAP